MAYTGSGFDYHHQSQPGTIIDADRSNFIDEDDAAVLDPSILDAEIMQSPVSGFRKQSFAASNGVLSPAESQGWENQYVNGLPIDATSAATSNPFHDERHLFVQQQQQQQQQPPPGLNVPSHPAPFAHAQPPLQWSFDQNSGNCTPTTAAEFMPPPPPPFDASAFSYRRVDSARGSFSQPTGPPQTPQSLFGNLHVEPQFVPAAQIQTPMSPHSHQEWMGMAQQEADNRSSAKRMRPSSPQRSGDFQRPEGIRKKNGRIDIPQERNIHTIDHLIEKETDDEILKELKQQKRLLRNREAALASRQRKKKHTEDLEFKEKGYTQQIASLEQRVANLNLDRERREHDMQIMFQRCQEAQRIIETLEEEKRDIIAKHNEEASSLRKKVQVLTDHIEAGPAPTMSAAPSSAGYTDFNADMEALNMGPHDWENFIYINDLANEQRNDFSFETGKDVAKPPPALEKKSSSLTITPTTPNKSGDASSEQPIASGLLFMLLLCGAFVASKQPDLQSSGLPRMPPAVRAAAPTVLSNLLSEQGVLTHTDHSQALAGLSHEPLPSGLPFAPTKPSRLDQMHQTLTTPTKRQEIDSAFALTTAQFASITNMNAHDGFDMAPEARVNEITPRPKRNLAEALATMEREHARSHKAEVYTRSLLWDQIPADVVRQFKDLVRDHEELEARQKPKSGAATNVDFKIEV